MKKNKLWNLPPRNPVQTMQRRFKKNPAIMPELPNLFEDNLKRLKKKSRFKGEL